MSNRINKLMALIGVAATIMIMSNMTSVTSFAADQEADATQVAVETTQVEVEASETAEAEEVAEQAPVEEVGTAQAGNFEEEAPAAEEAAPVAEETAPIAEEEAPVSEETPEHIDAMALEQALLEQAERIVAESKEAALTEETAQAENTDPSVEGITEEGETFTQEVGASGEGLSEEGIKVEVAGKDEVFDENTAQADAMAEGAAEAEQTEENEKPEEITAVRTALFLKEEGYIQAEYLSNGDVSFTLWNKMPGTNGAEFSNYDVWTKETLEVYGISNVDDFGRKAAFPVKDYRNWVLYPEEMARKVEERERIEAEEEAKRQAEAEAARIEAEKLEKQKAEEMQKDLETKLNGMSKVEIYEYWTKISTVSRAIEDGTFEKEDETNTEEEKNISDMIQSLGIDIVKETITKSIDKAVDMIPGSEFVGSPISELLKSTMGLSEEEPDVIGAINKQTETLDEKLDDLFTEVRKDNINSNIETEYGNRLDEWENCMNLGQEAIDRITGNGKYDETQKLVRFANIIGGEDSWMTAGDEILNKMNSAAQVFIGGTSVDPSGRSIFDLAYDRAATDCLFAGEAMIKCENYLQTRMDRFIATCNVYVECLKAHKQVAQFTEEQIAGMDEKTYEIYSEIVSSEKNINSMLDRIAKIFIGTVKNSEKEPKSGKSTENRSIFETATEYYSKDKTVYIDHGNQNVDLKEELGGVTGNVIKNECGWDNNKKAREIVRDNINAKLSKSGFTQDDIKKIAEQAKAKGMTIKQYLEYCGFNVKNLDDKSILVSTGYANSGQCEYKAGAKGYKTNEKNATEKSTEIYYYDDEHPTPYLDAKAYRKNAMDIKFIFFEVE